MLELLLIAAVVAAVVSAKKLGLVDALLARLKALIAKDVPPAPPAA